MNKKITLFLGLCLAMAYAEDTSVGVSTSHMYKVNASTDVLGRHNSKVAKTPSAFVATPKTSLVLKKSGDGEPVIEASSGQYEKYKVNGTYRENYWFNKNKTDSANYVFMASQYDARFANTINFQGKSYVNFNYLSAVYSYSKVLNEYYGQDMFIRSEKNKLDTFFNINTLIKENGLYNGAISKKERGQGIGVYVVESAQPNKDEATFKPTYTCTKLPADANFSINHASKIAKVINHLASDATVYTIDHSCISDRNTIFPTRPDLYKPYPIYIGNHSYGTGSGGTYTTISQNADNFVYNTRVIEVASAGNSAKNGKGNNNISEMGRGLNVVTVGAAKRHNSGKYTYYDESSVNNPRMPATKSTETTKYYDKPEIINMANVFFSKGYTYTYNYNKTQSYPPTFSQTSSATPYTVGMIADLLHQKPFYKWHPEVVKALLLTSSVLKLESNENQQDDINGNIVKSVKGNFNKLVGRGMPSYTAMINGNRSRYWLGNKNDHFVNNKIVFSEPNITSGKTYRIAIAWLVDGNSVNELMEIPQNIDLKVSQAGNSSVKTSNTISNPFEMVEFKATNNNDLTITITRVHNHGNNRVMLGYNLYEVP